MNNQEKTIYAIRNLGFWYDDEYYHRLINGHEHMGHISALFDDKNNAIQEWKRVEYEFSHQVDFVNILGYEEAYYRLEQLGLEAYDEAYLKDLDQDSLFDIIHKTDCHVYSLYEYPHDSKIKTLWRTEENNYDLCDATTDYDFRPNIFLTNFLSQNATIPLRGALTELSDSPLLLTQLIQNNSNIEYDEKYQVLRIPPEEKTLNSVNALLKKPLFEIRYLTIKEIYEIEQTLNQTPTLQ